MENDNEDRNKQQKYDNKDDEDKDGKRQQG